MTKYTVAVSGKTCEISSDHSSAIVVDGSKLPVEFSTETSGVSKLRMNERTAYIYCKRTSESTIDVWIKNYLLTVSLEDPRSRLLSRLKHTVSTSHQPIMIKAPMPGLVITVEVTVGDTIAPGDGLVVLEAMKMENEIRSTVHGKVSRVEVAERTPVEKDQLLLAIEPANTL